MKPAKTFNFQRFCTKCKKKARMVGAITSPKFICKDCRPKVAA